ncbi:MAG: hypothetical protein KC613_19110, partial [Myxococcales bacterium]|nr:hypothetical protein [Myxococcales bacterium]
MAHPRLKLTAVAALSLGSLWACDTLECGPGTHREGDLCVSNVIVGCAPGTTLRDGRCEADGAGGDGGQ